MLIYLISDDHDSQIQYNNSNVISDFKIKLAQKIELIGYWEVALVEAHIPYTWVEYKDTDLYIIFNIMYIREGNLPLHDYLQTQISHIRKGMTIKDIINEINKNIDDNPFSLKINRNGKVQINIKPDLFKLNHVEKAISARCVHIELSQTLATILGYKNRMIEAITQLVFTADVSPSIPSFISTIAIHCDLVENQNISSKLHRILRILPIQYRDYNHFNSFIFSNPYFLPMRKTCFNSIHIQCFDDKDESIHFESGIVIICIKIRPSKNILHINN